MKPQSGLSHFISKVLSGVASLKVFWREWNVQTIVIVSLTLQLILILVGPFRQRTSNGVIIASIWLSYLLADWVAAQGVGLISKGHDDLFAFWAQFLLLHLGGPDTVTALAVEDNNLWLRTGLHLGVQVYTTSGVLVNSIQHSRLWVPTILMFLAGIIKYLERVSALRCGRVMNFDKDVDHFVEGLGTYEPQIMFVGPPLKDRTNVEMVRDAFYFFNYFKGLYADRDINYAMEVRSMRYFNWIRTPADAFNVLEIHFNFAYEALYTKMGVIQTSTCWKILRPVVMSFDVVCLVIWCFSKKHGFQPHDIRITYALLIGAIFVDVLSIFRIQFSYWSIAHLKEGSKIRRWAYNKMLSTWNRTWGGYWRKEEASFRTWFRRALFRQWSEYVSQLSLLSFTMDERSTKMKKVAEFFGITDVLDGFSYVTNKWFSDHLRDFIFDDLKCKSIWVNYDDKKASFICYAKGSYAYLFLLPVPFETLKNVSELLVGGHPYDEVLLRWHLVTDLFYYGEEENVYAEICKTLSDYMIYLLLQRPSMISALITGNTKKMFGDARQNCEQLLRTEIYGKLGRSKAARNREAYKMFRDQIISEGKVDATPPPQLSLITRAEFPYSVHPIMKDLAALEKEKGKEGKWKFMAEVWAELVYYAAIRCRPSVHAAQLKQGGELLSFIWLLMVQLGFGLHGSELDAFQLLRQFLPRRLLKRRKRVSPKNPDPEEPIGKKTILIEDVTLASDKRLGIR